MRHWLLAGIAAVLACQAGLYAENITPAEQAFFDGQVAKLIKVDVRPLHGLALDQCFDVPFYDLKLRIHQAGGLETVEMLVARQGQKMIEVSSPGTDAEMPQLKGMLKPQFKLRNDKDAQVLQEALDTLYPIASGFGDEDLKAKAIKHEGDQWVFVRGKFADNGKGFVFKTAPDGSITSVSYSLGLK
jgi:hypothetical protein